MISEDQRPRLAEIRARVEKATQGPWTATAGYDGGATVAIMRDWRDWREGYGGGASVLGPEAWIHSAQKHQPDANAEFIAHAREDIPYLLDLLASSESVPPPLSELVTCSLADPDWVAHPRRLDCEHEAPHLMAVCGAFAGHVKPEAGPMRDAESPSGVQALGSSGPANPSASSESVRGQLEQLKQENERLSALLRSYRPSLSEEPEASSPRPCMLPQSFFPVCGCTLDTENGNRIYVCPKHFGSFA